MNVEATIEDANAELAAAFGATELGDGNPMSVDMQPRVGSTADVQRQGSDVSNGQCLGPFGSQGL